MREETSNPFPWIFLYVWKTRNDMLFNNVDRKPPEILKLVLKEALAWAKSAVTNRCGGVSNPC